MRTAAICGTIPRQGVKTMIIARFACMFLLALAVAHSAAAQAQPVDAFRVTSPSMSTFDRSQGATADERQLQEAFLSGKALTDLSLSVTVNFRQMNSAEYVVPVSVRIAPSSDLLVGRGPRSRLDFIAAVTDPANITHSNTRDAIELKLGPASIAALATTPIVYDTAFTLLPGRYTVRVLARDQTTGRMGTADVAFTIPNLNRQQPAR